MTAILLPLIPHLHGKLLEELPGDKGRVEEGSCGYEQTHWPFLTFS